MRSDRSVPAPQTDPQPVLQIFLRDPQAHPYGIADVAQLWQESRWWRDGEAVVGLLDLPASPPVLYAVSARDPARTRQLLRRLAPALPDQLMATGPVGLADALRPDFTARFSHRHVKMHLAEPARLPPPDPRVRPIGAEHLAAFEKLLASDPSAGDFFHPALLDTELYVGWWEDGRLAAGAGVHVVDERHGVAALGNIVADPAWRRRGLGRAVTATLCHRLLQRVGVIGLNVRQDNLAAQTLYSSLGFRTVLPYDEAELMRQ